MIKKFSYPKTFLLGFGFFGVSIIWATYNAFVPLFLANKFELNAAWIGFFMTLDNIAALLIQPPVGAWSDRLRTPLGRRIPFILVGAPIGAIAFGLIPLAGILPLFVCCTSTLLISMAFWRTPVIALMPDITPSKNRSQANGIINFMGGLGSLISYFIGSKLYDINEAYPFWLGSILVVLSAILVFVFIKEPPIVEDEEHKEKTPNIIDSAREVITEKEKSPLRILLAILFWFISYNGIEAFFSLYGVNYLHLKESETVTQLGFLSLIFLIFALPSGYIGGKFGRRKTIMVGIIGMTLSILAIAILPTSVTTTLLATIPLVGKLYVVGLILMFAGLSWACININSLPMVVDMTIDKRVGTFTGLYYLASTIAAITGPNLYGWLVTLNKNDYSSIVYISPVFLILAFIMMMGVRRGEAKKEFQTES